VFVVHQPVKAGARYSPDATPDYDIFDETARAKHTLDPPSAPARLFVKETVGHTGPDCSYEIFPDAQCAREMIVTFLFRDPIAGWNSWRKYGFGGCDLSQFETAYRHLYDTFQRVRDSAPETTVCLTYEYWMAPRIAVSRAV
jgi:hypothetical protein